jgi:hypothetical protein
MERYLGLLPDPETRARIGVAGCRLVREQLELDRDAARLAENSERTLGQRSVPACG